MVNLEKAIVEGGKIPDNALWNAEKQLFPPNIIPLGIRRIILPEGVTEIGKSAFANMIYLERINLPSTLRRLGLGAFDDCKSLTSIVIPEGVEEIPAQCFMGCESINRVLLPSSLKIVGAAAFQNNNVAELSLPEGLERIGEMAFQDSHSLRKIVIPGSCVEMGTSAFEFCENLTEVSLSGGVTRIPDMCFRQCLSLDRIDIPGGVTEVGSDAFYCCEKLVAVTLPEGLKSIGDNAFSYCSLDSVVIPKTVEYLGSTSFGGSLEKIYSLSAVPPVCFAAGEDASRMTFSLVDRTIPVYIPKGSYASYTTAYGWEYFWNFFETDELPEAGIESVVLTAAGEINVRGHGGVLVIDTQVAERYAVYSMDGIMVASGETTDSSVTVNLGNGVYIVKVGQSIHKIVL